MKKNIKNKKLNYKLVKNYWRGFHNKIKTNLIIKHISRCLGNFFLGNLFV